MDPKHFESLYPENTRSDELKAIISYIKNGAASQVVGLPGVGKSNVLGFLAYNKAIRTKHLGENAKWFHFVYMDFSEVRKRKLFEVIKFMLISLSYSFSERNMTEEQEAVNTFLKEAVTFQDEMVLFQALKKSIDYLAVQKELTVVFLFDKFDQYLPDVEDQFFINLRILRNRAKYRFSCVFALTRPLEDILDPTTFADYYEFLVGNVVYLKIYDPVGLTFRLSYIDKVTGQKLTKQQLDDIIKLTGGHGKLTRLSYESILAEKSLKPAEYEKFLLSKNQIQAAIYEIWSILNPEEEQHLRQVVEKKDKTEHNCFIEKVGLIQKGTIAIPLFASFVPKLFTQVKTSITYNEETNEIMEGSEIITEKLSPSEFRLLRFFIQNPARVIEKDEIINAVWRDTQTQEGVTDQALDQIIYRLRKKIEQDPNNPTHIQTIKGKGYRFVS
jgi:hypothetical protein